MPSGKTHTKATVSVAILVLLFVKPIEYAFIVSYGALIGVLINPDLDVDKGHYGFHVMRVLFGNNAADIWRSFWKPYAKLVPHRHWISHFPVISTFIRFLYVLWPILLIFWFFYQENVLKEWIIPVFYGTVLVDSLHFIMDIFSSFIKRKVIKK